MTVTVKWLVAGFAVAASSILVGTDVGVAVGRGTPTARRPCGPGYAHTISANSTARVYRIRARALGPKAWVYYRCTASHTKPEFLGFTDPLNRIPEVELRGSIAGYLVDQIVIDLRSSALRVADLRTARVFHTFVTYRNALWVVDLRTARVLHAFEVRFVLISGKYLVRFVLDRSGDVAWASVSFNGTVGKMVTIRRATGRADVTLDQGADIRPLTLRLRGHILHWFHGMVRRQATLP